MKKEKTVRTYQRRTKSGKVVTVRQHTASYDAAEKAKEMSKKKGAGDELEEKMKKKKSPVQLELPFEKDEEKKVLDEVKGEEKKSTSKKSEKSAEKTPVKKGTESKKSVAYSKAKVGDFIKGDGELSTGKVLRAKSDISEKLAKSYAKSEGIPIRQAYQELMVASKNEYRKINAFHNGPIPKKEPSKKPAEKKTTAKDTRYASGAKLNEDGTFVSEKDYKKSIAHRKKKGARISPEEVKAIKKWESVHKESKFHPVGSDTNGPTPKRKAEAKVTKTTASKPATSEPAFTAAEFKEWYRGTGSAADKKVAKALRAQLGRSGYRKLEDEAIDNYSSRGHLSMFKRLNAGSYDKTVKTGKDSKKGNVVSTKDIEDALGWNTKHSKAFKDALAAVHKSGARTTAQVREALKNRGFDYDTGKKIKGWKPSEVSDKSTADKSQSRYGHHSDTGAVKEAAIKHKLAYDEDGHYVDKNGQTYDISARGKVTKRKYKYTDPDSYSHPDKESSKTASIKKS